MIDPWGLKGNCFKKDGINYCESKPGATEPATGDNLQNVKCFNNCVAAKTGNNVTVTGCEENGHPGVPHSQKRAIDVRKDPTITSDIARDCAISCNYNYGWEEGNHFHFQTGPDHPNRTRVPKIDPNNPLPIMPLRKK